MALKRRNATEIEKDFRKIRVVVETTPVTSIKEIGKTLGLTDFEVKTSLARHPRIEKNILAQLKKNKEELKAKKKAEKEALETQKKAEEAAKRKQALESKKKKPEVANKAVQPEKNSDLDAGFVIDASIAGIENLENILSNLCEKNERIILTSITIKELERMQKYNDIDAMNARHILAMAAENNNNFHAVLIDETIETPDDCIIKYCTDHKDTITLLTSDKTMALKARMYGVQTQYFKHEKNNTNQPMKKYKRTTLLTARKIGKQLIININNFTNNYRSILVISNGIEYTTGVCELKIGDDVYLATKKPGYLTFAHYQIISLSAEDNCNLIYYNRIHEEKEILDLPKAGYKSFMRNNFYK